PRGSAAAALRAATTRRLRPGVRLLTCRRMPSASPKRPHSRATVFLTVASLVSLTVLLVGTALPARRIVPFVFWQLGDGDRAVEQYAEVPAGTALGLTIELPFAAHVYVASWSALQGTIELFPSARLSTELTNPLPDARHWLPATLEGTRLTWPTHAVVGPIHYLVVVSREPCTGLEETLRRVRQMGHMARLDSGFGDRSMYVFAPEGGMKVVPPNDKPAAPELE